MSYLVNMNNIPKLTGEERWYYEGKLIKNECWKALFFLKSNNNLGNDGLSTKLYSCIFDEIRNYLLELLNYSFVHGQLRE